MCIFSQSESKSAVINESTVDKPHSGDKANGTQYTDGRKITNGIKTLNFQDGECHRIGQRNGRHIESTTQGIERYKE